jgi:hypothetical protein
VAEAGGRLLGARVLMRWAAADGRRQLRLARAVDTATDPAAQGRGIFSRLTARAVEELTAEGVAAIFNTPNGKSLPGYLKLGWTEVGRVPVRVLPQRVGAIGLLSAARSATASKWGEPTHVGLDPAAVLDDGPAVDRLLASLPPPSGLATPRTALLLRWRFGFRPLHYRAALLGTSVEDGLTFFRLRRRGPLRELCLCDALVPAGSGLALARVVRRLARATAADLVTTSAATRSALRPGVTVGAIGPVLTWRPLSSPGRPALAELGFTHADLELF